MSLHSYTSPYQYGHNALSDLWDGIVYVTEKIDGSQFSFGIKDGVLHARSRNKDLSEFFAHPGGTGMFGVALKMVQGIAHKLQDGWTYRGEFLQKPKHNTLKYDRIPRGHIILFDIDTGLESYLLPVSLEACAAELGLECVPLLALYNNTRPPLDELVGLLDTTSVLGGGPVEGVVLKNYDRYGPDKKLLAAKLVRDDFKEKHAVEWGTTNPSKANVLEKIVEAYRTEARWAKAVQHLSEDGRLEHSPRDIGLLIREVPLDVRAECEDEIKQALFNEFWGQIQRGITKGFADWYKRYLAESSEQGDL
jgi:hypothetical protein